jgi:hypothetical protein
MAIFLKFVGPRDAYRPEFGANADWEGDSEAEAEARIACGWWVLPVAEAPAPSAEEEAARMAELAGRGFKAEETLTQLQEAVEPAPEQPTGNKADTKKNPDAQG